MQSINRKDQYMRALRREPVDALTWAPNFDYWYVVNTANGTIPPEYRGLSCNDIIRAVGGTIWRRVTVVASRYDESVTISTEEQGNRIVTRYRTPVGELSTVHQVSEDSSRTTFLKEHLVKSVDDLKPLRYLIDATQYELSFEHYEREAADVGDDGILLTPAPCVPFIQFAKTDVGYENAYYLLADSPEETQAVIDAYHRKFLEFYRLVAQGPCELVTTGDNMDQLTCPPHYFQKYAVPYYQEVREILHAGGKIAQGHWCGQLDQLVPLMADCGLDVIEAVTPKPMSKVDMRQTMDLLEGNITIQGGVPSVYMCDVGCTRDELARYIEDLLEQIGHCRGFILGMGDNVPDAADFARVKMVSEVVAAFNSDK